jgi:hypothetical protein
MLGRSASSVVLVLCLVAFLTAASGDENPNKTDWCASFVISDDAECTDEQWQGVLKDMFSPDDTCPDSTRYIDVTRPTNAFYRSLEVSASGTDDNCNSTWGRRFNSTTSVNPTISRISTEEGGGGYEGPCVRATSFVSKVTPDNPLYADAQAGALNFTLKLGTVNGSKVNMWNGVYDGQGGDMNGAYVAPSNCDNFWQYF